MAGNLNSLGRPISELMNLLELSAIKIQEINIESIGHVLAETVKFLKAAGQFFKPVGYVITAGIQLYYLVKSILRLTDKNNRYYNVDSLINGVVAAALIAFALVSIANPAMIFAMSIASTIVGALRDMKALAKSFAKNAALKEECKKLYIQLTKTDQEDEKIKLRMKIHEMDSIIKVRQYKIAQRITGVATSLVCVACIAVALSVGPIGWTIMGVATLIGLATKLGIYLHKRNNIDERIAETVDWVKARDKEEYQNTYISFLSRLGKASDPSQDQNNDPRPISTENPMVLPDLRLSERSIADIIESCPRSAPAA